jgi:uncharacterized protein (DUF1697 family)
MTTYISLLRGINVSGQRMIKMTDLKELYKDLTLVNIYTYKQSGNVVFQCNKSGKEDLELQISNQIQKHFGLFVPVIVLKTVELEEIIEKNPYLHDETKDISHLHVTFLSSVPEQIDFDIIYQNRSAGEEFSVNGTVVYLYCPNGYGKTRLTNAFFENKLKVSATTRNWKTATELLNIAKKL